MEFTQVWSIGGSLAAVLAVVTSVLIYRRQFPKRRLTYSISWSPLLNRTHDEFNDEKLEIRYGGRPMLAPYIGLVEVFSNSRADIPTDSFDSRAPVVFDFSTEIVSASIPDPQDLHWLASGSQLLIPAQLIRQKAGFFATVVVEGAPTTVKTTSSLIDIPVISYNRADRDSTLTTVLVASTATMAVVAIGLFVLAAVNGLF